MAKKDEPREVKLARLHMKYLPPPRALSWIRAAEMDAVSVLVDVKESRKPITSATIALVKEVPDATWDLLRQFDGVYNMDELADLLELPSWERVSELNSDAIYQNARAMAADNDEEFYEAEQEAEGEIWKQWRTGVMGVVGWAAEDLGLEPCTAETNNEYLILFRPAFIGRDAGPWSDVPGWKNRHDYVVMNGMTPRDFVLFNLRDWLRNFRGTRARVRYEQAFG